MQLRERITSHIDELVSRPPEHGITLAIVAVHCGEVVAEWYGTEPDTAFGPGGPVTPDTTLVSWSTAKSMTHAAVGIMVADGRLEVTAPAAVPEWAGTPKAAITLLDLLEMRPGLRFVEDYVDGDVSHCIAMLWGEGAHDHAAYAAALPLDHPPGAVWNYSSGTTNIVSRIVGDLVVAGVAGEAGATTPAARQAAMTEWLRDRLFAPAGMHSAIPKFDGAGNWVGSSYVYATARDFARFGELYRRDGIGPAGDRVLPAGWADHGRTFVAHDPDGAGPNGFDYGRHWWMWPEFPGSITAHGYEGQYVVVVPDRELTVVHLGKTPRGHQPALVAHLSDLVRSVPAA